MNLNGPNTEAFAKSADTCAAREGATNLLRNHANNLRRQAGELHEQANRIEQLANFTMGVNGHAEEALYRLAVDSIYNDRIRT